MEKVPNLNKGKLSICKTRDKENINRINQITNQKNFLIRINNKTKTIKKNSKYQLLEIPFEIHVIIMSFLEPKEF